MARGLVCGIFQSAVYLDSAFQLLAQDVDEGVLAGVGVGVGEKTKVATDFVLFLDL